jgi:hypothetical protein
MYVSSYLIKFLSFGKILNLMIGKHLKKHTGKTQDIHEDFEGNPRN